MARRIGSGPRSVHTRAVISNSCPFCALPAERIEDATPEALVVRDMYPVAKGHTLILPRRHIGSFFEPTAAEQAAMLTLLVRAKDRLQIELTPGGFNVGINDGAAAGQTVPHVHMQLIPRHRGDVIDPRGGVRWVIPENARCWKE